MKVKSVLLLLPLVIFALPLEAASVSKPIVGVNVVGVDQATDQQQDDLILQLEKNGVTTIRTGLGGHGERYTSFVIKAFEHGIGSVVITSPFQGNSQKHALTPDAQAGRPFGLSALSDCDPVAFSTWFDSELTKLEAAGVRVTAFELGNELNTPRFNADFRPEQTSKRILTLSVLANPADVEGSTVASGFKVYVKLMAALKHLRDNSKINQETPLLTGMSADWGPADLKNGGKAPDAVSIPDSIAFLRMLGVDQYADGYAVHTYPSANPSLTVAQRSASLLERGVLPNGTTRAKPIWMTEWGINNSAQSCPLNDVAREKAVQTERNAFLPFIEQGRLKAILYYSWSGVVTSAGTSNASRNEDQGAIFRCGALTNAGKSALTPME